MDTEIGSSLAPPPDIVRWTLSVVDKHYSNVQTLQTTDERLADFPPTSGGRGRSALCGSDTTVRYRFGRNSRADCSVQFEQR